MKQKTFIAAMLLLSGMANAQTSSRFYGVARNVSTSTDVYLATVDSATGVVTNIGSTPIGTSINLTGAALDPYTNNFYFVGGTEIKTINLTTGAVTNSATLYNPIADSYFENYRFNNSDTTVYGLARTVVHDTDTAATSQVFLATVNPATGTITQLSTTSVGAGFSMGGSAIDPYQKVFYFTNGLNLIGVDMYDGSVYSNVPISVSNGIIFDNIAYSCADTTIYGLVRQNYYDTTYDAIDSTIMYINVDSTTLHLGKINPNTGVVTTLSPYSIASGGYSLNSGATIDPNTMVYYYNNGSQLIGVSLATGLIVSSPTLTNTNGDYFELMRIHANCIAATTALRTRRTTGVNSITVGSNCQIFPNPSSDAVTISHSEKINKVELVDIVGNVVNITEPNSYNTSIDLTALATGTYVVKCYTNSGVTNQRLIKK